MGYEIAVGSVVYNLAGEEENRPSYLKSLVIRNVLDNSKRGIGEAIINGHLNGPGIKLRSFYRWASNPDNYDEVGMPTGSIELHNGLDPNVVADGIPAPAGKSIWVQTATLGYAKIRYWAEQFILENIPALYETNWVVEQNSWDTSTYTLTFEGGGSTTINTSTYDQNARYIYAYYSEVTEDYEGPIVTGSTVNLSSGDSFPSTTGWVFSSEDPGPPQHTIYTKNTATAGPSAGTTAVTVETMHWYEESNGNRSYRIDTQEFIYRDFSPLQLFIYKIGSGVTELDNLVSAGPDYGGFFPFLPIRIENEFLSDTNYPDAYTQVKKAYRKATDGNLSKLIEQLEDNDDLADIDNAYITFGVSLNVLENTCRKYLYRFFEKLQASQAGGPNIYQQYLTDTAGQQAIAAAWKNWRETYHPLYNNVAEPERPAFSALPDNSIRISGTGTLNSKYDVRLNWAFINAGSGTGLAKPGAKKDELWFEYIGSDEVTQLAFQTYSQIDRTTAYDKVRLYWQVDENSYTYLEIIGAVYRNYVYGTHAVEIGTKEALEDPEDSGFIVPIHYETWEEMGLIESTQMSTASIFIVFNSYVIRKKKWYESGLFRIFVVIVIAIVTAVFAPAGVGLLGAHVAVGTALGFSGLTAAIVGSIANALAAMILFTMIEKVTGGLGPLGQIIAAVLLVVVGQVASSFHATGTLAINWGDLLRADSLLRLTGAIGDGVAGALRGDILEMQTDWMDYQKQAGRESRLIQQAYLNEFGYGNGFIDPLMFVDSSTAYLAESSDTFLTRTLMTGSEIAEMSRELLYNFPEFSLKLPDAFT